MNEEFTHLAVGKLYTEEKIVWPEGYDYNYRAGQHELRLFFRQPHAKEVEAVKGGPARFSFNTFGMEYMVFSFGFSDPDGNKELITGDCSYSVWLVPEDEREPPSLDFPEGWGAILTVLLINAENGILESIRVLSFTNRFTKAIHETILKQFTKPLPKGYAQKLMNILALHTTAQLLNSGQRCKAGEVD